MFGEVVKTSNNTEISIIHINESSVRFTIKTPYGYTPRFCIMYEYLGGLAIRVEAVEGHFNALSSTYRFNNLYIEIRAALIDMLKSIYLELPDKLKLAFARELIT